MIFEILISIAIILFFAGAFLITLGLVLEELTSWILADYLIGIGIVLFVLGLLGGIVFLCLVLLSLVWS